jgi:hypothetical protein
MVTSKMEKLMGKECTLGIMGKYTMENGIKG